jgi:hypothetical protein
MGAVTGAKAGWLALEPPMTDNPVEVEKIGRRDGCPRNHGREQLTENSPPSLAGAGARHPPRPNQTRPLNWQRDFPVPAAPVRLGDAYFPPEVALRCQEPTPDARDRFLALFPSLWQNFSRQNLS